MGHWKHNASIIGNMKNTLIAMLCIYEKIVPKDRHALIEQSSSNGV